MVGRKFFEFLGITMGSFYITRGIILAMLGVAMLNSNDVDKADDNNTGVKEVTKKNKADISVTPFGVPIICGPVCITATIALPGEQRDLCRILLDL
jgi:small neutral amino acid transporter SnatA (MarC family)